MSRRFLFVLLGLTLAVYGRAIGFEFLSWDDRVFIQENPLLQMPFKEALKAAFLNFFFGDYLPLTQMSLWLDTLITGAPHSGVSHAVNIALHLGNVTLLFILLSEWRRKSSWLSELAVTVMLLFFALHPLQVESVAWVSERKGLLSAFFALAALIFFVRKKWVGYTLSFFASTLCKTSNLALPLVALIYDRFINKQNWRTALIKQAPALTIALTIGSLRIFAYANLTAGMADAFTERLRWLLLPIQIVNAIGFYLRQMLWPQSLSPIYPLFQLEPMVALHLFIFGAFSVFTWRAHRRGSLAPILFMIGILLLLPVLQIVPRLSYVNDRYFYMPLWAAAGLVVSLFPSRPEKTPLAALIAITLLLVAATSRQLDLWSADLPFWTKTARLRPDSGIAFLSLGQAYEKESDFTAAAAAYEKAANLGPDVRARALSNLSSLHADNSRPLLYDLAKAEGYLQQALESPDIRTEKPGLIYNLARLRFLQGRLEESENLCREIVTDIETRNDLRFENLKALSQKCFH